MFRRNENTNTTESMDVGERESEKSKSSRDKFQSSVYSVGGVGTSSAYGGSGNDYHQRPQEHTEQTYARSDNARFSAYRDSRFTTPSMEFDELQRNAPQYQIPVSMQTILQSLSFGDVRFSIADILKYGLLSLTVMIVLLYLFPQQILMIMALILFMLLFIVYIAVRRININNCRINVDKLDKLRKSRNIEADRTRGQQQQQ